MGDDNPRSDKKMCSTCEEERKNSVYKLRQCLKRRMPCLLYEQRDRREDITQNLRVSKRNVYRGWGGKNVGRKKRVKESSPHKDTSATSSWVVHLVINRMKKRDSRREAKVQDCHTVVAQSSMMRSQALMPGNSVIVHVKKGGKDKACMCRVTSRNL